MNDSPQDLFNQRLLTAREIGQMIPSRLSGKTISAVTVRRWQTVGLRGIHLGYVIAGGIRCSTKEQVEEFFHELTQQDMSHRFSPNLGRSITSSVSTRSRSRRALQTETEAKKLGL